MVLVRTTALRFTGRMLDRLPWLITDFSGAHLFINLFFYSFFNLFICTSACVFIYLLICLFIYASTHPFISAYLHSSISVHTPLNIHMHALIHTYAYTYTYTSTYYSCDCDAEQLDTARVSSEQRGRSSLGGRIFRQINSMIYCVIFQIDFSLFVGIQCTLSSVTFPLFFFFSHTSTHTHLYSRIYF